MNVKKIKWLMRLKGLNIVHLLVQTTFNASSYKDLTFRL